MSIVLHQPPRMLGVPNPSPFCVKVEAWLRFAGVPHEVQVANPLQLPRGKVPYIDLDGERIPDSAAILRRLEAHLGDPLGEARLAPDQRHLGHLVVRTLEEATYFLSLYERWCTDESFRIVRRGFFGDLPPVLRDVVATVVRRGVRRSAWAQGAGRYTDAERAAKADADADAIAWALGDKPYLLGDGPHAADATLFGFLVQIDAPFDGPWPRAVRRHPNLVAWKDRVREQWFADLPR